MRSRVIDIALLLGLVAVAGAIMWTLFNLGGSPRVAPPTPAPAPTAPAVPDAEPARVIPVAPGGDGLGGAVRAVPEPTDEPTTAAPTAPVIGEGAPGVATPSTPPADAAPDAPDPSVAGQPEGGAAAAPPVGSGPIDVERLGFSFVTGGPGACGVVLEPWTHVAVSRELLDAYGCGARVRVTLADAAGGRSSFEGVVGDTMNPLFARTVNVYVGTDEPAFEYGVTTGTITPLD